MRRERSAFLSLFTPISALRPTRARRATRPTSALTFGTLIAGLLCAGALTADDGDPDYTFSGDGVQIIGWGAGADAARATAVVGLADGSMIVGGTVRDTGTDDDFGLVKLTRAGEVDLSWGALGRRVIAFDDGGGYIEDYLYDIAELADGSFLVSGWNGLESSQDQPKVAVAKLTPDGDLDETFSGDGKVIVPVPFSSGYFTFDQVLHQPDGKILYLGDCQICPDASPQARPFVLRLTTTGTLDTSFSGDGVMLAQTPPWSESYAQAFALDSAGRIFVVSQVSTQLFVARLTPAGLLDPSFGGGLGFVPVALPIGASNRFELTIDSESGAMFISYSINAGDNWGATGVIRLDPNGTLDSTYGGDGETVLPYEDNVAILATRIQSDGKLMLAGFTDTTGGMEPILFRLLPNGSLDNSFDSNGLVLIDYNQGADNDEYAQNLRFVGGRPVVVAAVEVAGTYRFGISRSKSTLIFSNGFEGGTQAAWTGN